MKTILFTLFITGALANASSQTVFTNGKLLMPDGSMKVGQSLAIESGKISAIESGDILVKKCLANCTVVNLGGKILAPSFHDSHAHTSSGGRQKFGVQVSGSSVSSIAATVRAFAAANPQVSWIRGRGWYAAGFGTKMPTRQDLDKGESKRPVVLSDSDGHVIWVNTAALKAAGITKETPDPKKGHMLRDSNGEPTGVFQESATDMIMDKVPDPTDTEVDQYIMTGHNAGLRAGFASFQGGPVSLQQMKRYAFLQSTGKLKQRSFLWGDLEAKDEDFKSILEFAKSQESNDFVKITAFKGFLDGVVSSYTAALVDPYTDQIEMRGDLEVDEEKLKEYVLRVNMAGFPVALHAIGDRAVRTALNAFEYSQQKIGRKPGNRIEHIELVHPADIKRFGELGVIASFQPSHMHFGGDSSFYYYPRLGQERSRYLFAWQSIQKAGAMLTFGTDYPVVGQDASEGLNCAIQRTFFDGTTFNAEEKVNVQTAIQGFTVNPAIAIGMGDRLGVLQPGAWADISIYSETAEFGQKGQFSGVIPQRMFIAGEEIKF